MALAELIMKSAASKAQVIKINLALFAFFAVVYFLLLLQPPSFFGHSPSSLLRCSLLDCRHLKQDEEKLAVDLAGEKRITADEIPSSLDGFVKNGRVGLVNIAQEEVAGWRAAGRVTAVGFEKVSENFEWKHLYPEWIDEEEENEGALCPEMPMPEFSAFDEVDVVVARLPCRRPKVGWARDVFRLQVHLVAANMAARRAARDGRGAARVAVVSKCRPMIEIFRCEDLVRREGDWWMYELVVERLEEKLSMPLGSCKLALPLWGEGTNQEYNLSSLTAPADPLQREAYATVLHSNDAYVCGAIALAQSIKKAGTDRDLLLLHDKSLQEDKLQALTAAGWKLRLVERIRNPRAEKGTYNEYNYSKLRLWQLTDYQKVVFVDADIIVLRSLDVLFHFPEMSATGNDGSIFNSGVMVIRPSNCTFDVLMKRTNDVISYNGGDQGFLNEIFVWWHRMPRRVNYLKNFWANTTAEASMKNALFAADPPKLYSIHYLGLKPWICYRDYDCNWNIGDQRVYASDDAHRRWWAVHDEMDVGLQGFCRLSEKRKRDLDADRSKAGELGFQDSHWSWNITDRRRVE